MDSILRKCDSFSTSGLAWATTLVEEDLKAAPFHELVISTRDAARLSDLTVEEEIACWNFARERAIIALQNSTIEAVGFLMNDGVAAGQTVGHVHIHIVGFSSDKTDIHLSDELNTLSRKFSAGTFSSPANEKNILLNTELVEEIRHTRENMAKAIDDPGFSIFTDIPLKKIHPEEKLPLTIQVWSATMPRQFGLTNLLRVWNGYRQEPYAWPEKNQTRIFERKR